MPSRLPGEAIQEIVTYTPGNLLRWGITALAVTLRSLAADPAACAHHAAAARRFASRHDLAAAVSLWHALLTAPVVSHESRNTLAPPP